VRNSAAKHVRAAVPSSPATPLKSSTTYSVGSIPYRAFLVSPVRRRARLDGANAPVRWRGGARGTTRQCVDERQQQTSPDHMQRCLGLPCDGGGSTPKSFASH
jgi:hypothetical protein